MPIVIIKIENYRTEYYTTTVLLPRDSSVLVQINNTDNNLDLCNEVRENIQCN